MVQSTLSGRATVFRVVLLLAGLLLAGCSQVHLSQRPDDLIVRAGSTDTVRPAAEFGGAVAVYALLADHTYADEVCATRRYALGDRPYCWPASAAACQDLPPVARRLLERLRLVFASNNKDDFRCVPGWSPCTEPLDGLGVQIRARKGTPCPEIVVAFRGTDGASADDWLSNLRCLTRALPIYDQHEQVQDHSGRLLFRRIAMGQRRIDEPVP